MRTDFRNTIIPLDSTRNAPKRPYATTTCHIYADEVYAMSEDSSDDRQHKKAKKSVPTSVAYHGGSSHFFGIGIYPVSDWLGIGIFGQYRSPLFRIVPPFFPRKGGCPRQKGGHCPPFEEKRGQLPPF